MSNVVQIPQKHTIQHELIRKLLDQLSYEFGPIYEAEAEDNRGAMYIEYTMFGQYFGAHVFLDNLTVRATRIIRHEDDDQTVYIPMGWCSLGDLLQEWCRHRNLMYACSEEHVPFIFNSEE